MQAGGSLVQRAALGAGAGWGLGSFELGYRRSGTAGPKPREVWGAVTRRARTFDIAVYISRVGLSAYLAARLRRDHPGAVFDESVRGSVRQAAIAAGIVKVPSALDQFLRLWKKATPDEGQRIRMFCETTD